MPAVSKAQFRFMESVASGDIKRKGLSKKQAKEYIAGQSPKKLPTRSKKASKKSSLKKKKK